VIIYLNLKIIDIMSLKPGYSYQTVQANIAEMIAAGHPRNNAIAAAYANARKDYFKRYPKGALPVWLAWPDDQRMQRKRKQNPVPPSSRATTRSREARIAEAGKLFEQFTGHDASEVIEIDMPAVHDVMLNIGEIDGILYTTVRDGVVEKYIHKFRKNCRPLFAVSHDGKQLYMLGGSYDFTERGIVDKT